MTRQILSAGLSGVMFLVGFLEGPAQGGDERKPAGPSVTDLSREVSALQSLYSFDFTRPQLEALRKIARATAQPKQPGGRPAKASAAFRRALAELRDALVKADDDEKIGTLVERLEDLREAETPDIDDEVETSDEAMRVAPEVVRLLAPAQVAGYAGAVADDIPDPREVMHMALGKVRGLPAKEWEGFRDEVSGQVSGLLAGLDDEKGRRIQDRVVQLLIVARSLKPEEFAGQRSGFEKKIDAIIGEVGPTDVIRNVVEQALAELLSNPRLPAALDARLKREESRPKPGPVTGTRDI